MKIPFALVLTLLLAPAVAAAQVHERAAMLSWINAARASVWRAPLATDPRLDAVAQAHAEDMARHRFFSHDSPTTGAPADRAAAAGLRFRLLAENIALDQSVRGAHDALMRSPGHRANILHNDLHRVGIGIVHSTNGVYVAQLFATFPDDPFDNLGPRAPFPDDDTTTPPVIVHTPSRMPATTLALPVDPRLLQVIFVDAQRRVMAFTRDWSQPGLRTGRVPFDPRRLPPATPSWSLDGDETPCGR